MRKNLILIAVLNLIAFSCNKNNNQPVQPPFKPSELITSPVTKDGSVQMTGASENLKYAAGQIFLQDSQKPVVWDIVNNKVKIVETGTPKGGVFESINGNGDAAGYSFDEDFNTTGIVYDNADSSLSFLTGIISSEARSISENGNVIAGASFVSSTSYYNGPSVWINREFSFLPLPPDEEIGFEYGGGRALFMSRDASVIVGCLMDKNGTMPLVYWNREGGSYRWVDACEPHFRPQGSTETKPYMAFEPSGISNDGICVGSSYTGSFVWQKDSTVDNLSDLVPQLSDYRDIKCT